VKIEYTDMVPMTTSDLCMSKYICYTNILAWRLLSSNDWSCWDSYGWRKEKKRKETNMVYFFLWILFLDIN